MFLFIQTIVFYICYMYYNKTNFDLMKVLDEKSEDQQSILKGV